MNLNFNFNSSSDEESSDEESSDWESSDEESSDEESYDWGLDWESDEDNNHQIVIEKSIIPNQQITVSKQVLKLSAIVIHYGNVGGGHYIALLRCRRMWYLYNDTEDSIEKIGSYRNMLDSTKAMTRGVLYMYM